MENTEAKLLENLDVLTGAIAPLGASYAPPNANASLAHLQERRAAGQTAKDALDAAQATEATSRDARQTLYADLNRHGADLVKYAQALGWDKNTIAAMRSFVRELRGDRAAPKVQDNPLTLDLDESNAAHSAAQTSYASREATYSDLIAFMNEQGYATTESGFKMADLIARRDDMRAANTSVAANEGAARDARQTLDEILYTGAGSAVQSAAAAKNYLKARFGDAQAWQAVKRLEFRIPKRLR